LGLLIAALWSVGEAFAAITSPVPLFVARWAIGQFAAQEPCPTPPPWPRSARPETKELLNQGP